MEDTPNASALSQEPHEPAEHPILAQMQLYNVALLQSYMRMQNELKVLVMMHYADNPRLVRQVDLGNTNLSKYKKLIYGGYRDLS